jgi:hypothetical protein
MEVMMAAILERTNCITLYRPIGLKELELIKTSGYRNFPPRLLGQPIFYPVCNIEYAQKIAIAWNYPIDKAALVVAFNVNRDFLSKYETHIVGDSTCKEYWIPAGDLEELNNNIIGLIELVTEVY